MPPETRHLRYFLALADALSFTRAARDLGITQQVLSTQIARLEQDLGVRLFDRDTRRVTLTEPGSALVDDARAVLGDMDALWDRARELGAGGTGLMRIGYWPSASYSIAPLTLAAIRAAIPTLVVEAVTADVPQLLKRVRADELDLAFVRWADEREELFSEPVRQQRTGLVVLRDDPLAELEAVPLDSLQARPIVLPGLVTLPGRTRAIRSAARRAGVAVHLLQPSVPLDPAFTDVRTGLGPVVATEAVLDVIAEDLCWRPFADAALTETVRMVWSPARTSVPRDRCLAIVRELSAVSGWLT